MVRCVELRRIDGQPQEVVVGTCDASRFSFCLSAVPVDLLLREAVNSGSTIAGSTRRRSSGLWPRGLLACPRRHNWGSVPAAKLEKAETRERREGEGEGDEQE